MLQRNTPLYDQVNQLIRQGINSGRWIKWLPPERELGRQLNVSRNTIRAALAILKEEHVIQPRGSQGTLILKRDSGRNNGKKKSSKTVRLLTPKTPENEKNEIFFYLNRIQELLTHEKINFEIHHGKTYFSKNPSKALDKLVSGNPCDCWILLRSSIQPAVQHWFEKRGIPTIIWGLRVDECSLPFVDNDQKAAYRHAVGLLLKNGHQRIGFIAGPQIQGNREKGIQEGCSLEKEKLVPLVIRHDWSTQNLNRQLTSALNLNQKPTAFLIQESNPYLTVHSLCLKQGLNIPEDISLICLESDPYVRYLNPKPTCYEVSNLNLITNKLFQNIMTICQHGQIPVSQREFFFHYELFKGETVLNLNG